MSSAPMPTGQDDARVSDILTLEQLAQQFFHTTADAIYSRRKRDPASLPPAIEIPGIKRIFWHRQTVEAWFLSHQQTTPISNVSLSKSNPPRSAGRPTKTEQVRAKKLEEQKKLGKSADNLTI